jgi:hypothetical protein
MSASDVDRAVVKPKPAFETSHLRSDRRKQLRCYERLLASSARVEQPAHHLDVALADSSNPRLKRLARSRCILRRSLLLGLVTRATAAEEDSREE